MRCGASERHGAAASVDLAKKGELNAPIPEEVFLAFAALEVVEERAPAATPSIELEVNGVILRLPGDALAGRIAELAAALREAR